jgi:hypothetical protein
MGFFYFDESVHPRAGFALGAFVYSGQPLEPNIAAALRRVGLRPGVDEWKSGDRVPRDPARRTLRVRLRDEIRREMGRIGIVVAPTGSRESFARESLVALKKIIAASGLVGAEHTAFFDEGIFVPAARAAETATRVGLSKATIIHPAVDSRRIGGIQAADLAAHMMATMLLERLGFVDKELKAGPNSGYDPEWRYPLGFELWASLRHHFFAGPRVTNGGPGADDRTLDVASHGLHVSERCDEHLRRTALGRFGSVYLGCIH